MDKDNITNKLRKLDLTKKEDVVEYLELCEELRNIKGLRFLYGLFEDDFDKFIDDLKNIGYEAYARTNKTDKPECDECKKTCVCEDEKKQVKNHNCVTSADKIQDDGTWEYNDNLKNGDYGVALNEEHLPIYIGIIRNNTDTTFTLARPNKFVDEDGLEQEPTGLEEITLAKSFWQLDEAISDEVAVYNGKDPFCDCCLNDEYDEDIDAFLNENNYKNNEEIYEILMKYNNFIDNKKNG